MKNAAEDRKEPDAIEDLLPWYATGRISDADKARIDKALLSDPELARRLAIIREEIGEVTLSNESMSGPSSRAFDKVMAGVAAQPRQAPVLTRARQSLLDWLGGTLQAFSPRTLALAACTAVAIVALQTAMLGGLFSANEGGMRYDTASAPSQVNASGTFVMVAFAPAATVADVSAFLRRFDASIQDGPRASGLFRLKVGSEVLNAVQRDALLDRMKKETAVVTTVATAQ